MGELLGLLTFVTDILKGLFNFTFGILGNRPKLRAHLYSSQREYHGWLRSALVWEIINYGKEPVYIREFRFYIGREPVYMRDFYVSDPAVYKNLPCNLQPGTNFEAWLPLVELAKDAMNTGKFSGSERIRVCFLSADNSKYWSKQSALTLQEMSERAPYVGHS